MLHDEKMKMEFYFKRDLQNFYLISNLQILANSCKIVFATKLQQTITTNCSCQKSEITSRPHLDKEFYFRFLTPPQTKKPLNHKESEAIVYSPSQY